MVMKGQKINDRYQIIKSIGEGGMANVYLAYDTILDRDVAVKVLRGDLANDEKFVRRFQREALAASSLSHPNIVEVYDVGEDDGEYYIVMEYIEGKHLKSLIKKRGKLTVSEAVDIVLQITAGLSVAHDSYIIHRDIKPQNILILENGLVKITDFGIAMAMNSTQLTQTNSVMGSVHYLPPEQASGKGATLQSDIYSIGILFYELLTGKLPFKGDNAVEIALKHLKENVPGVREENPSIPQSVENIIIKATAKNPKNRYADAREMHEDLLTCLDPSRINEPKITLKYNEISDDTRAIQPVKKEKVEVKKEVKSPKVEKKKNEDLDKTIEIKQIKEEDMKKQNSLLIKLAIVFTGLVVAITAVFVCITLFTKGSTIEVPDVSNKTISEATKILQKAGFVVSDEQENIVSENTDEGKVVKTSPGSGNNRKKGSTVKLYISSGEGTVTVEDYKGKNYLEVKGMLNSKGISVEEKSEVISDPKTEYKDGDIIGQSVEPGEKIHSGDTITLTYAQIGELYPDFTDGTKSVTDVENFAEQYKLKLTIKYSSVGNHKNGDIISQSRKAGSVVKENATFSITVYQNDNATEDIETDLDD